MATQEFELSAEDMTALKKAATHEPMSMPRIWSEIGDRVGFNSATVVRSDRGPQYFMAEPKEKVTPEVLDLESLGQQWLQVTDAKHRSSPHVAFQSIQGNWLVLCDVSRVKSGPKMGQIITKPVNYYELKSL